MNSGGSVSVGAGMMHREKIDVYVDFPLDHLDVSPFCYTNASHVRRSSGSGSAHGNSSQTSRPPAQSIIHHNSLHAQCNTSPSIPIPATNDEHRDTEVIMIDPKHCIYDLFAVCNHYGRLGFGHYTAMARDVAYNHPGHAIYNHLHGKISLDEMLNICGKRINDLDDVWYHFDDEHVQKIDASDVRSSSAYILFYQRRKVQT